MNRKRAFSLELFQYIFKIFLHNFKHSDSKYPFKAILDLDGKHIFMNETSLTNIQLYMNKW